MATRTLTTETALLTEAFRAQEARRAAMIAALVVQYWRQRVEIQNPESVERWLALLVPRILAERKLSAARAQRFGDKLRKMELPGLKDGFKFPEIEQIAEEALRTSLRVTGPISVQQKVNHFRSMRDLDLEEQLEGRQPLRVELDEQMLWEKAKQDAEVKIAGSVVRHVQNGARETLIEGAKADTQAMGFVRVTKANPCYFCAMIASRGVDFGQHSFDMSDARFVGGGTAKVHDGCGCGMKPVYRDDDEFVEIAAGFEQQWLEWGTGTGAEAVRNFRAGYEGRTRRKIA